MEANHMSNPETTAAIEFAEQPKPVVGDEKAGQRIKDLADKVGVFGSSGAIILGLFVWDNLGFLTGFLFTVIVILAACAISSLLFSYGEAVSIAYEQSVILTKLEAERTVEPPVANTPEIDRQPEERQPEDSEAEAAVPEAAGVVQEPPDISLDSSGDEPEAAEAPVKEKEVKPKLPSEAYEYDKVKRIAYYAERSRFGVVCPVCGKWQTPENDTCFRCSCKFCYDDDVQDRKNRTA